MVEESELEETPLAKIPRRRRSRSAYANLDQKADKGVFLFKRGGPSYPADQPASELRERLRQWASRNGFSIQTAPCWEDPKTSDKPTLPPLDADLEFPELGLLIELRSR